MNSPEQTAESVVERLEVKAAIGLVTNEIGDKLIDHLIQIGELQYDFEFRALAVDPAKRDEVIAADVLSRAGIGKPSDETYLTGPLPDCVLIPAADEQVRIIKSLSEDYHRFADFQRSGENEEVGRSTIYNIWASYVKQFNPDLYDRLGLEGLSAKSGDPVNKFTYSLGRIVIRDAVLFDRYQSYEQHLPVQDIGRRILFRMLSDNHMELGLLE